MKIALSIVLSLLAVPIFLPVLLLSAIFGILSVCFRKLTDLSLRLCDSLEAFWFGRWRMSEKDLDGDVE